MSLPPAGAVPVSYHVVYRVTAGSVVSTEELWVHRPFEAEDVTFAGAPGGAPISTIVDRLGRQLVHDVGGVPAVLEPPPAPTPFDIRLDAVAPAAEREGVLVAEGTMDVAGRACRVYRSAVPLASGELDVAPSGSDHVDTCVDGTGLLLDERRVAGGRLVSERRAAHVAIGDDRTFVTPGLHIPLAEGGGRVVTISASSRPPEATFWELDGPPAGFVHVGRFAVVPPQAPDAAGTSGAAEVATVADVFVRGPDAIIVEQGQTLGGAPLSPPVGTSVAVRGFGRGTLTLSGLASSVTMLVGRSAFVRVTGTLPTSGLLAVAADLRPQPGGTITLAPDATSDGP